MQVAKNRPSNNMMQLKILGCSGGIGSKNRTTSLYIDEDILLDCGTGVGDLSLEQLQAVRHVFLTHSHLDHIAFLPLLVDSGFEGFCETPLVIHALPKTIETLQKHIFNWDVWPDFSRLPDAHHPVMRFEAIVPNTPLYIHGREITPLKVVHAVEAVGYRMESSSGKSFAFSGDSSTNDSFWDGLNRFSRLDLLLAECAYPESRRGIASMAGHYHSSALIKDLEKLRHRPDLMISHLSPGLEEEIMRELAEQLPEWRPRQLRRGDVFTL